MSNKIPLSLSLYHGEPRVPRPCEGAQLSSSLELNKGLAFISFSYLVILFLAMANRHLNEDDE